MNKRTNSIFITCFKIAMHFRGYYLPGFHKKVSGNCNKIQESGILKPKRAIVLLKYFGFVDPFDCVFTVKQVENKMQEHADSPEKSNLVCYFNVFNL